MSLGVITGELNILILFAIILKNGFLRKKTVR